MSPDDAFEPDEAYEDVEEVEEAPVVAPKASGPVRRRIGGVPVDPETKEPLE